ncbi:RNA-guided endonuclease InsQ/TnpB family protein [Archaeoglobus sp.]
MIYFCFLFFVAILDSANKRYLEIDLTKFSYLPKDYDSIGGLILTENKLIVTFKKKVELTKPKDYASFDVNLTNITGLINGRIIRFDLREIYHIHRVYEKKRRKIQKLAKTKPKTAKKLMQKYSKREKNRVMDLMHKITTTIARELKSTNSGAILEDLRNIKDKILNGSKNLNRKLSKWNWRSVRFRLEYKLKLFVLPVKYVNPAHSSKTCPVCQATLVAYRDRLMKCNNCGLIADRDVVAVLNLQMWGSGVTPNGDKLLKLCFRSDEFQSGCLLLSIR